MKAELHPTCTDICMKLLNKIAKSPNKKATMKLLKGKYIGNYRRF